MSEVLQILSNAEPTYRPSNKTAEAIRDKNLIAFIGAFAVGKTTLIEAVAAAHPDYTEVISFTTRPPRDADDRYRFIEHRDINIKALVSQVRNGDLVNFTVHPTTGYVYGTEPKDYRSRNCMLATTSKSYESDKLLPFESVKPLVVVARPHIWINRIDARVASPVEKKARMVEAAQSLEWSLSTDDTMFINNSGSDIASTAIIVIEQLGGGRESKYNRRLANAMLVVARGW